MGTICFTEQATVWIGRLRDRRLALEVRSRLRAARRHDMHVHADERRLAETARQASPSLKLLLPVDGTERSRWGINYAIRRRDSGCNVAASLLTVAEPITNWQVLRFLTQERIRRFQAERGRYLLEDAALPLRQAGIPVQAHFREGDVVFEILDLGEQLACDEIVLPMPYPRWARLFSTDIVQEVIRRQRAVPVTTVNAHGEPERVRQL